MPLRRLREPFDHDDWLYELKYDGFRCLAYIDNGACRLVSRNRFPFSFRPLTDALQQAVIASGAVLDGELVCVDGRGHPQFNDLLYRRSEPHYFAFDVLSLEGQDLRHLPLMQRKNILKRLVHRRCERLVYVDHIVGRGSWFYEQACQLDLEGVVAKHRDGRYIDQRDASTWVKIKNPRYTQVVGRDERFQRLERPHEPEQTGWGSCVLACREV